MGNTIPSFGNLNGYTAKEAVGMTWRVAFLRSRQLNEYQRCTGQFATNRFVFAGVVTHLSWPLAFHDGYVGILGFFGLLASWSLVESGVGRLRHNHQEAGRLIDAYGKIEEDAAVMYARGDTTVEEARELIAKFRHVDFGDYKNTYPRWYVDPESDQRNFSKLLTYRYDTSPIPK